MINITAMIHILFFLTFNPISASAEPNLFSAPSCVDPLPDMVERISPAVTHISSITIINYQVYGMDDYLRFWGVPQERKQTSLGSGVILDQEGFLLTNHHVVQRASEVLVTLLDKRQYKAKIIGKDDKMDVALLQLKDHLGKPPTHLSVAEIGDSDTVRIGETVVAVGNPFGLQNTVTKGIISAKNRTIGLGPFDNFLQTDASINPGNSGGGLFNLQGQLIGMNTAIRSETGQSSGLGFAIPANEIKKILADLKRYGRVLRPWLGILVERLSPALARYYHLGSAEGVLIGELVENAPADLADLQRGDIILEVDKTKTIEPNDIEKVLAKHKPVDRVSIKILRGQKVREILIQLQELPKLEHLPRGII